MPKITKTFSVDERLYNLFDFICKENNINKSSLISEKLAEFTVSRMGDLYNYTFMRDDKKYKVADIQRDNNKFVFLLDDDSEYDVEDFVKLFKKLGNGF